VRNAQLPVREGHAAAVSGANFPAVKGFIGSYEINGERF
jgi:hypothetical protein